MDRWPQGLRDLQSSAPAPFGRSRKAHLSRATGAMLALMSLAVGSQKTMVISSFACCCCWGCCCSWFFGTGAEVICLDPFLTHLQLTTNPPFSSSEPKYIEGLTRNYTIATPPQYICFQTPTYLKPMLIITTTRGDSLDTRA